MKLPSYYFMNVSLGLLLSKRKLTELITCSELFLGSNIHISVLLSYRSRKVERLLY